MEQEKRQSLIGRWVGTFAVEGEQGRKDEDQSAGHKTKSTEPGGRKIYVCMYVCPTS
jgi:hypothetical protein